MKKHTDTGQGMGLTDREFMGSSVWPCLPKVPLLPCTDRELLGPSLMHMALGLMAHTALSSNSSSNINSKQLRTAQAN